MDSIRQLIGEYHEYNPAIESSLVSESKYLPQLENPMELYKTIQMFLFDACK